jgi:chromosome segregation ATPase
VVEIEVKEDNEPFRREISALKHRNSELESMMNDWRIRIEGQDRLTLEWTQRETEMTIEIQKLRTMLIPIEEELRIIKISYTDSTRELDACRKSIFAYDNKIMTFENDL